MNCACNGDPVIINDIPWMGLSFTARQKRASADPEVHFRTATSTCVQRYPVRHHLNFEEIIAILKQYKGRECHYRAFAGEIVVFRDKGLAFIDTNRSIVLLFGSPWNLLRTSIFVSGVLAMIVPRP